MRLPIWYKFRIECPDCGFKFQRLNSELVHASDFLCPHCKRDIRTAIDEWRKDAEVRLEKIVKVFMEDEIRSSLGAKDS